MNHASVVEPQRVDGEEAPPANLFAVLLVRQENLCADPFEQFTLWMHIHLENAVLFPAAQALARARN